MTAQMYAGKENYASLTEQMADKPIQPPPQQVPPALIAASSEEIWKPVVGYEGRWEISSMGRVRSLPGNGSSGTRPRGKLLKTQIEKGYEVLLTSVMINFIRKSVHMRVHRMVALAFIPNPEGREQVNHIDGNKLNNHLSNLEWATRRENMQHAIRTGLVDIESLRLLHKHSPIANPKNSTNS